MTEQHIQTAGPADPNAPMRAKVWAGFAVLTPLIAALATFGILSDDQANAINGALTAAVGLLAAFGFGAVAKKTNEQVKNGTFDAPPAPPAPEPPKSPVDQILDSIPVVTGAAAAAVSDLDRIRQAATDALGVTQGLAIGGSLTEMLINLARRDDATPTQ